MMMDFLQTIFEYAETGYTQIFALPTTAARAIPVTDFTSVLEAIQAVSGQDIYFSPGITGQPKDSKLSTTVENDATNAKCKSNNYRWEKMLFDINENTSTAYH